MTLSCKRPINYHCRPVFCPTVMPQSYQGYQWRFERLCHQVLFGSALSQNYPTFQYSSCWIDPDRTVWEKEQINKLSWALSVSFVHVLFTICCSFMDCERIGDRIFIVNSTTVTNLLLILHRYNWGTMLSTITAHTCTAHYTILALHLLNHTCTAHYILALHITPQKCIW